MALSVKLTPFIRQWSYLFLPYQSLSHYRTLLNFSTELLLYQSVTARQKVYLLCLLYAVNCLLYGYFWAFHPLPMDRHRLGDFVSLVMQTDTFYVAWISFCLLMIYWVGVLFLTMKAAFLRLFEDILFQDRNGALEGVGYGTVSEQKTARCIFLGLINLLHLFVLVSDGVILFVIYLLINTAIANPGELLGSPLDTPFTFIWNVSRFILGSWTIVTSIAFYAKICCNVTALGAGLLCLLFRRLRHSETFLAVYSRKDRIFFSWVPFCQYLTYSGQTFQILFTTKDIFGRLFFAFLVAFMPFSAWAIVQLSVGSLSLQSKVTFLTLAAQALNGCLLIHWALAKLTKRLHAPSKILLSLNASTGHRVGNFRARLLLHHTIVRLHTKAKYGITYGSVGGLITMGSFGKCMLLYMELLMYAYTLYRGI